MDKTLTIKITTETIDKDNSEILEETNIEDDKFQKAFGEICHYMRLNKKDYYKRIYPRLDGDDFIIYEFEVYMKIKKQVKEIG